MKWWAGSAVPDRVTLPWLHEVVARGPWAKTAELFETLGPALALGPTPPAISDDLVATMAHALRTTSASPAAQLAPDDLTPTAAAALERALGAPPDDGPALRVALVGGFSSGKSSLLNALVELGARLPAEVEPTTSCITELHRGDAEECDQELPDGTWKPLPAETLAHALRGLGPEAPHRVRIHLPHPLLAELVLVDTPGVGSEHPAHLERVDEELGRCDAALLICDATRAGSEDEAQLLDRLARLTGRTWIVLTMVDKVRVRRRGPSRDEQLRELENDLRERFRGNLAGVVRCSTKGDATDLPGIGLVRRVLEGLHAERHQRRARVRRAREGERQRLRRKAAVRVAEERRDQGPPAVEAVMEQLRSDWREEVRVLRLQPKPVDPPAERALAPLLSWLRRHHGSELQVCLDAVSILDAHEFILRCPAGVTWRRGLIDLSRLATRPARWTTIDPAAADMLRALLLAGDTTLNLDLPARFAHPCSAESIWAPEPCAGLPWMGEALGGLLHDRRKRWVERLSRSWFLPPIQRARLHQAHASVLGRPGVERAHSSPTDIEAVKRIAATLRPAGRLSLRPLRRWALTAMGARAGRVTVVLGPAIVLGVLATRQIEDTAGVGARLEAIGLDAAWLQTAADALNALETTADECWDAPEVVAARQEVSLVWREVTHGFSRLRRTLTWPSDLVLACDGAPHGEVCGHVLRRSEVEVLLGADFSGGPRAPEGDASKDCPLPVDPDAVLPCVTFAEAEQLAASMPGWRLPEVDEAREVVVWLPLGEPGVRAYWTSTPGRDDTRLVAEQDQEPWHLAETTRIETIGVMLVPDSGNVRPP